MKFYKFDKKRTEVDLVTYVNEYLEKFDENTIEIMVGTDSQTRGRETIFATVVGLYNPGKGVHCIYKAWSTKRFREDELDRRLMKEVEASIDVAEEIKHFCWENPKYIDLDINPEETAGSNIVYQAACGYVKGMGYECRFKTMGPLITTLADWIVKHKNV